MRHFKVVFFGPEKSGKTELVRSLHRAFLFSKISLKTTNFNPDYTFTRGMLYTPIVYEGVKLELIEVGGTRLPPVEFRLTCYKDAKIGVYCVDLSCPDLERLQKEIGQFKEINPFATLYLVGTKSDACPDPQEQLKLVKEPIFSQRIITSAKEQQQTGELLNLLFLEERLQMALSQLYEIVRKIPHICLVIQKEIELFLNKWRSGTNEDKMELILQFVNNCHQELAEFEVAMKALCVVVETATIIATIFSGVLMATPWIVPPALLFTGATFIAYNFFGDKKIAAEKVLDEMAPGSSRQGTSHEMQPISKSPS